jgi:hypothetical protein
MDTTTLLVLAAVAVILAGAGGYWFLRSRRPKAEEPVFHFPCPHCKRRLGYRKQQFGHSGQCPRCRKALTFPSGPLD